MEARSSNWTLLTNHGAVLFYVSRHPNATIRQVADDIDISERAAARILSELRLDGYLVATRTGRRNSYTIARHLPMRHGALRDLSIAQLLAGLEGRAGDGASGEPSLRVPS